VKRGRVGVLLLTVLLGLSASRLARAAGEPAGEDPWIGKARAEVIRALGEPSKIKRASDGSEALLYTFRRVPPDAPPHPDALLLHVPGVGLVAKIGKGGSADTLSMDPPLYDEQGRPAGGGLTRTSSASSSYDLESHEVKHTASESDNPEVKGKVKVRFDLDERGVVRDWSFTGGKH
jgi:hypothetical protein